MPAKTRSDLSQARQHVAEAQALIGRGGATADGHPCGDAGVYQPELGPRAGYASRRSFRQDREIVPTRGTNDPEVVIESRNLPDCESFGCCHHRRIDGAEARCSIHPFVLPF
jgi:hypothetical protein